MFLFLLSVREIFWLKNILLISTSRRNVCHKGHFKFSFFEYIGCMGLSFLDLIVIWHMVYAIIPNMVHTFINQPFKIFRVPVISVKTHGHALLYYPFQKSSSLPSPPKNCNFLAQYLPLDLWFFKLSYCQSYWL